MIKIQGYDDAIIGPAYIWHEGALVDVLVYDAEEMRTILMRDGMSFEKAREYIEQHIEGNYLGPETPVLVWPCDLWSNDD